ncbi:hypothetical protein F2Q69_00061923 [Brassica cretica]|uniref:Uncharacterized protein n=1 Tax=Brassica cretica TaxID=69181 RepID=A0A8S9RLG6_BRACR|nr:hypothetical protein F2Q69_00061923 [Brassica cretica]
MNPQKFSTNVSSEYTEGHIPRNIPTDTFLGIFRGLRSSEFPDEDSEERFVETSEDCTIGKSIKISRGSSPSVYSEDFSDELVVLGVSSEILFLRIPSEISEGFPRKNEFPRSFFRGLVSSSRSSIQMQISKIFELAAKPDSLAGKFLQSLCGEPNIPSKCGHGCSTHPAEPGKSVLGAEFVDYEEPCPVFNQELISIATDLNNIAWIKSGLDNAIVREAEQNLKMDQITFNDPRIRFSGMMPRQHFFCARS